MKSYRKELWFQVPGRRAFIGFSHSTAMGLALLGAYLGGRWLVYQTIVTRFERRVAGKRGLGFVDKTLELC